MRRELILLLTALVVLSLAYIAVRTGPLGPEAEAPGRLLFLSGP